MAALSAAQLGHSAFRGQALLARPAAPAAQRLAAPMPVRASQTLQGKVVSVKQAKTAVVAVEGMVIHPVYGKRMKNFTKYPAHDEEEKCQVGDVVELLPSKPLSKRKRFVVGATVKKAEQ